MTSLPPIAVFDLDGTLAETAGDLVGTLNVILAREGLRELPLAEARDMIGAGAKALIQRGFAAAGQPLPPETPGRAVRRFPDPLRREPVRPLASVCGRRRCPRRSQRARLPPRGLHQQDRAPRGRPPRAARRRRPLRCHLRSRDLPVLQARPAPHHPDDRAGGRRSGQGGDGGDSRADIDAAKAAGIPVIGGDLRLHGYARRRTRGRSRDLAFR